MLRSLPLTFSALVLGVTLAIASPEVRVQSLDGVPRIELTGSYPQTFYTIYRAVGSEGPWSPVGAVQVLCLGPCFADDPAATAGGTYWYRFDFQLADGSFASFGPFEVTIPQAPVRAVAARMLPNPSRGPSSVELHITAPITGSSPVVVRIFDLQGRLRRTLHDGAMGNGVSRLGWDGRDDAGRPLAAGAYFLSVRSPLGESRTRFSRVR